ncbi:Gfo/Idh/MocA family protein [Planctomicrobium sp. SH661]|uniref:Gfo/Idh/MocA family protein n=1 Tax=Planctomicrobium sp. SH661 TaxID=3448124 RepID=UPI003F5B37A2
MLPLSNRREFLSAGAALGTAWWVGNQVSRAEEKSPNSKVSYACIGVGGKGNSDSADAANLGAIVAICDVDARTLEKKSKQAGFENAEKFSDFREMLDQLGDKIDAVTVSTPDHMHAPAAAQAMKMKKAVYCQKPLTHTVWEARRLSEIAKETGVATQMGNQGTANSALRHAAVLLKQGILGKVKEVHVVTNRPSWPQGAARPAPAKIPPHLSWDLWLGAAPLRPYANGYHAFSWRGYWDFGTGALGDMACHTFNMPFAGLNLSNPKSIRATCTGHNGDSYPQKSVIEFEFANPSAEGSLPVWWYDGGNMPPELLQSGIKVDNQNGKMRGSVLVGEDLTMFALGDYSEQVKLFDKEGKEVPLPKVDYEKSPGHFAEFHQAILGERSQAMSNFAEYAGPLTETILLGNLAIFDAATGEGRRIEWDAQTMTTPNAPELQSIVNKDYRDDWKKYLI